MYKAYQTKCSFSNIEINESVNVNHENNKSKFRKGLEYFKDKDAIDGTKLSDEWFPKVDAHVFISHSHRDEIESLKFASWLKVNFGITSFIDSSVWGYCDTLLKKIDNEYCLNPGGETYCYDKRNGSTSHVHMMLACALLEVMNNTECIFFLNTPNSLSVNSSVNKTLSPWIYFELSAIKNIRIRPPARKILVEEYLRKLAASNQKEDLRIEYKVSLKKCIELNLEALNEWNEQTESRNPENALDWIYKRYCQTESD